MTESNPIKRVVYLLGAGATHAEMEFAYPERKLDGAFWATKSLLLAEISKRVCAEARQKEALPEHVDKMIAETGLSNIELFFSLLEENHIRDAADVIRRLQGRLEKDIVERLKPRRSRFRLHKALFEFHQLAQDELLAGVISLNYDDVVDEAFKEVFGTSPNYCLTSNTIGVEAMPLLKLHGGFSLKYRNRRLPIVTPGVYKNYLTLPYSFVWGRALELLIESDCIRLIGCSLNQNDIGIVDLLFKAHLGRPKPPVLQLIDFDPERNPIREHFGFFRRIERALDIDGQLIGDVDIRDRSKGSNPFKIWLKAKTAKTIGHDRIKKTKYIKRIHT